MRHKYSSVTFFVRTYLPMYVRNLCVADSDVGGVACETTRDVSELVSECGTAATREQKGL